jgi:PAS domain S-box-containing protein
MLIQGADKVRSAPADVPAARLPPPAFADGPAGSRPRGERVPDAITTAGGLLCAAVGVTVMVAWFVRATTVVRFGSQSEMAFNTALAFAVTGAAVVALVRRRPRAAMAAGVFDVLLGAAVLAEYVLGRGLGIDQLFAKDYLNVAPHPPGRMAISAAVCTLLTGAALLARGPWRSRRRPVALAAAGSVIAVIAVAASLGHATSSPAAFGWANAIALSVPTASTMLVLALALLSAAWGDSHTDHAGLPRWLPMAAGALGLGVVLWQVINGRAVSDGRISAGIFIGVAIVLGLVMAAMLALAVWLAQQAEQRRQVAATEAARRSEAELAARENEHRLFQFLEAMPVGVHILSPGGRPYYASDEAKRLLGRGVAPDIGANQIAEIYSIFQVGAGQRYPTDSLPSVRALLGHSSHLDDLEIHRPDGSVIPLETWGRPVYGAGGQVDYGIVAFADISGRQAREKVIADQAALLELAHDAIFVRDPNGRITYWSVGAEQTYGFTRAQAVGQISHDLLRTRFPEPLPGIEATTARQSRWDGELTHRCADGRTIIVESSWAAQRAPDGSLLGFMEVNRDITARRQAEEQIRRTAALLEAAHDAIFVQDLDGRITYWNAGAERTYGFSRAEAVGQISHDMLRTQFSEPLASIEAATTGSSSWDGELTHRCADGRSIIVESRWAAERAPDGSLLGFMEVNRDITARKDAEHEILLRAEEVRELNAALEERVQERTVYLERANKNLAAFTYSAAHDLRTPLRGISGFAEVLLDEYGDRLEETGRGYAGRIQEASQQMAARLDALLHLSQVSRAGMYLQDVDLSAEVTAICDQLRARDPGRRVRVTIQGSVHATADRPLIRTALQELLENAWKFTAGREQATIEFGTAVDDASLCCYVRDNGAGFDPAYAGKLFQPFQRLHIGLASVQRIIDRHGGRTWAEGTVGGGVTIYFTLDAKNAP